MSVSLKPVETRILVKRRRAPLGIVARAALEMTDRCFVWLEREGPNTAIILTERSSAGRDEAALISRFETTLDWIIRVNKHQVRTRELRSAILGHALSPRRFDAPPSAHTSLLDPETEAEIEKLLAEIESDDWLEDEREIAKTWEERFGVDSTNACKEEKS